MQPQPATFTSTRLTGFLSHFSRLKEHIALHRALWGIAWLVGASTGLVLIQVFAGRSLSTALGALASLVMGAALAMGLLRRWGARLSDIGLVPLGALGIALWGTLALWANAQSANQPFVWAAWAGLGSCVSVYVSPLWALIRQRTSADLRTSARWVGGFLLVLWILVGLALGALVVGGIHQGWISFSTAAGLMIALHLVVAFYIFMLVPEYALRFLAWVLSHVVYRFKVKGDVYVPTTGAAIVVANHVSFVDAILLMAASPRPIRFIMDYRIFQTPLLGFVFKMAKAIPIAREAEHPEIYQAAFDTAQTVLQEGDLLGIFPEGAITRDGRVQPFKGGVMKILQSAQDSGLSPPVVPMGLSHLWGSFFSRIERNGAMVRPFRRGAFNRVGLHIGPPIPASTVTLPVLEHAVQKLIDDGLAL